MSSSKEEDGFMKASANQVKNTNLKQLWDKFISKAHQMLSAKEYGKSMSYFAYIVHHAPEFKPEIQEDFLFALKNWCNILQENNKTEDIICCLNEARKLFPNFAGIANYVGSMLFQLNMFDEAAVYFRHALTLDPGLFTAQEGLDSVSNLLVERWHFRMLNDKVRNRAYKNAIHRAVAGGCTSVLDIGSGSGILSMYAVESGAKEVFACETSKTMFDLSARILQANSMQDCIHVINKSSHDLKIPDDLPKHVSLVVTETLDCGLLGEGILPTMAHAQQCLMMSHGRGVTTNGDGNNSNNLDNGVTVREVEEMDMIVAKVIPEGATVYGQMIESEKIRNYARANDTTHGFSLSSVSIKGAEITEKYHDPYTTEDMSYVPHTPLSKPFHIMTYDFRTPEKYLHELHRKINLPVTHCGSIDAVVTWFELKLDEYETISSAPGCSTCWEQAVYPTSSLSSVEVGDEVVLDCKLTDKAIFIEVDSLVKPGSVIDIKLENTVDNFVLPFSEVSKLNDSLFNQCYQSGIQEVYGGICPEKKSGCLVLCSSPTFSPLFAVATGFTTTLCSSQEESFDACLEILRSSNNLSDTLHFTNRNLEELCGARDEWHLLVVDPVETSGVLRHELVQDVVLAKGCILAKDDGIVLPRKVEVWGMLITSDSLCLKSRVINNDVTLGLDIASYVNQFTVKNQIDVDVTSNPYIAMTEPMSPNDDDSLLKLLSMTQDTEVTSTKDGFVDGLMYWFEIEFSAKGRRLSTGPQDCSHFNQVVIVFKDKLKVSRDERLLIRTSCNDSCVTATVT